MDRMPAYKKQTLRAYEAHAQELEESFGQHFSQVRKEADFFREKLSGKTIVDVGAGPGTHAEYFQSKGLDVVCVDYSPEMLRRCALKGIKVHLVDMEQFSMPPSTVDGVWMYHSLIHVKDEQIPSIFSRVHRMLKPSGILGLSVREGSQDGFEHAWGDGSMRWFNFFTDEEIRSYVEGYFDVVRFARYPVSSSHVYLNYLFKKKPVGLQSLKFF